MAATVREIIYALRCASACSGDKDYKEYHICKKYKCPFYAEKEITDPQFYDFAEIQRDSKYYEPTCDAEGCMKLAATVLEELAGDTD